MDQSLVAMGVLVHQSFRSEKANGVGVSRNVFDPEQGHIYFLTVQAGEASVTNPAPGVTAESMLYDFTDDPDYRSFSTLVDSGGEDGARVLSSEEVEKVGCTLFGIDKAFKQVNRPPFGFSRTLLGCFAFLLTGG